MQHCILVVQDLFSTGARHSSHSNTNEYFQNYEIHVGDDSDYNNNPKCAGGPFMNVDDVNNYDTVTYEAGGDTYTNA